jgi:hypothetical protein
MADSEWYEAEQSREDFTNLESASDWAESYVASTGNPVTIYQCTKVAVRRYKRTVTVTAEDVSSA